LGARAVRPERLTEKYYCFILYTIIEQQWYKVIPDFGVENSLVFIRYNCTAWID
jgi:hypothetical protein